MYVLFNLFIFYKMSDFNMEDLQQLLKVSSSGEYLYYSLEKIRGYKPYINGVASFESLNSSIKEFINVLFDALTREEDNCLEKKTLLQDSNNDFMFPNIFSLDIDSKTDSLDTLVTKFSEKFEFYVTISNIINESYNGLEAKDQSLQQGYKITDDMSLVNKLNDATTKAYETPLEEPNISITVLPKTSEEKPAESLTLPVAEEKPAEPLTLPVAEEKSSEPLTLPVAEEKPSEPLTLPVAEEKSSEPLTLPVVEEKSSEPLTLPVAEEKPPEAVVEKSPEPVEEKSPEDNAVENEKNNNDEIIEMSELENLADNASDTLSTMADMIKSTMERMENACERLNTKKQEVQVCKASLEEFKAKGMNVDSALIPLNEQHDSIHNELNVLLNSYKSACIALGELAKE